MAKAEQDFAVAVEHHRAGRLEQAIALYRAVLRRATQPKAMQLLGAALNSIGQIDEAFRVLSEAVKYAPKDADSWVLLGQVAYDLGRAEPAIGAFQQAVALRPQSAELRSELGLAFKAAGRLDEAEAAYRTALNLKPALYPILINLGTVQKLRGDHAAAEASFRQALAANADFAEAHNALGLLACDQGRYLAGIPLFRRALALRPDYPDAITNLGLALLRQGEVVEARALLQQAVQADPRSATALYNLALACRDGGDEAEAERLTRAALAIDPDLAVAHVLLGGLFRSRCEYGPALAELQKAVALEPHKADHLATIVGIYLDQGRAAEAIPLYEQALALEPGNVEVHRRYVASLHYVPQKPGFIFDAYRRFEAVHAGPIYARPRLTLTNSRDPDRRLRIGYMSSDFGNHAIGRLLESIVAGHDKSRFEIFCYAEIRKVDPTLAATREHADHWREIAVLNDEDVARQIAADGIDILICCAAYFDDNRPLVMAWRPAPVQITSWDATTSGMTAVDYVLTDAVMTPGGGPERFVERPIRLPHFYHHRPMLDIDVGCAPCLATGSVTFGSFNNPTKLTADTIALWSRVLHAVPKSRLLLKFGLRFSDSGVRKYYLDLFAANGIAADRVDLRASQDGFEAHLKLYREVDIALDPIPYNGATTTFEALWMGVPVLTLLGDSMMSRYTAAMLACVGHDDLIAHDEAGYVRRAVELAADHAALDRWRQQSRARVLASPWGKPDRYVANLERVYRAVWRRWCARAP